jgi:hypothetical protein
MCSKRGIWNWGPYRTQRKLEMKHICIFKIFYHVSTIKNIKPFALKTSESERNITKRMAMVGESTLFNNKNPNRRK